MNNAINEIKNTLEGTNSRMKEAEHRMVEINETERKKEKRNKTNEDNLRASGTMLNAPTFKL